MILREEIKLLEEKNKKKIEDFNCYEWNWISTFQKLSEDFIEKYQDKVDWNRISQYQNLSEQFIEKFQEKVDWNYISRFQKLSEDFIEKNQYEVNWNYVSIYQQLGEDFIEKFQEKLNWHFISRFQILSESFIEEFQDKVDWVCISQYQNLSEDFIEKFQKKINWYHISIYQNLSNEFRKKHNLKPIKSVSLEEYANRHNLKIKDGYLYAFRNHNSNNSGMYKENFYYEKGIYYRDWHCDPNAEHENSFGFGIFPEGNTPIRVKVEDFCTGVKDTHKARVWGFEIL
jgi:phosphoribosylanthranilate isomerase